MYGFMPVVWDLDFGIWKLYCGDSFRSRSERELKDSLLIAKEFLNAKKLRASQGANQNSSLRSSDNDLLERQEGRPRFLAEILKALRKLSFKV